MLEVELLLPEADGLDCWATTVAAPMIAATAVVTTMRGRGKDLCFGDFIAPKLYAEETACLWDRAPIWSPAQLLGYFAPAGVAPPTAAAPALVGSIQPR